VFLVLAIALSLPRSISVFRSETTNLFSTSPAVDVISADHGPLGTVGVSFI
jgi:hypothetical protein